MSLADVRCPVQIGQIRRRPRRDSTHERGYLLVSTDREDHPASLCHVGQRVCIPRMPVTAR